MTGIDLKVLRIRPGVRQYDLAARLGMNPSRLSLVENGRVPLEPEVATRAAAMLSSGSASAAYPGADSPQDENVNAGGGASSDETPCGSRAGDGARR